MFKFIQNYLNKKEGIKQYKQFIKNALSDNTISKEESKQIEKIYTNYRLQDKDVYNLKKDAFNDMFTRIISNNKITEDDKKHIEEFLKYFNLSLREINFNQKLFNKYYSLGQLEDGKFPEIQNNTINIIYKAGEKLYWVCSAKMLKFKHITTKISYSGPRYSIRIMKGISYRAGSYNFSRQTREYLAIEDTGMFWMTNYRIGFKGIRKNFNFQYNKILYFELTNIGLIIAKGGKENPYILKLDDYDIPCSIASHILNK